MREENTELTLLHNSMNAMSAPETFNEDSNTSAFVAEYIPKEHRAKVDNATRIIRTNMASVVENLIEIGYQLTIVKLVLEYGAWSDWLKVVGIHEKKAQRLMNVYERLGTRASVFLTVQATALYQLAMPSTPKMAIDMVAEILQSGQRVSASDVSKIIDGCKGSNRSKKGPTMARFTKALRTALSALSNQAVEDCEVIFDEEEAKHFDDARMVFDELLKKIEALQSNVSERRVSQRLARSRLHVGASDPRHDTDGEQIVPGCTVTIVDINTQETACYTIVTDELGQLVNGGISKASALAQALLGKKVEEIAQVQTPDGIVRYAITNIHFPDGRQSDTR